MDENLPTISIVIPTYNSDRTLAQCLESIRCQDYPREKVEVIIADGGSKDRTREIARKYNVDKILHNPLRTGEAGKAVGVEVARNEIIALIDSDNILDGREWLRKMVEPFRDPKIVGSEPLYYTYRRKDSFITRYCALLGMNDVLCLYLGNYDRYSHVTDKWTELPVKLTDEEDYFSVEFFEDKIPTMGANGFLVRGIAFKGMKYEPFLFDIDMIYKLVKDGRNRFAKVKIGITHLFANNIKTFIKKTYRRIREYFYYERYRVYPWKPIGKMKILKFLLYTILTFFIVRDLIKGYRKVPDRAWLFHPIACQLTLLIYGITLVSRMGR